MHQRHVGSFQPQLALPEGGAPEQNSNRFLANPGAERLSEIKEIKKIKENTMKNQEIMIQNQENQENITFS